MLTLQELHTFMKTAWEKHGFTSENGHAVGVPISELIEHSKERNNKKDSPYVDLWAYVLDQLISWEISLLSLVYNKNKKNLSDFDRSTFLILAKLIGDSLAIRHLILLGFDNAARSILRSTSEYMELLVALLDDPALSIAFVKSDTPETAKEFWDKHLAKGGIRKRIFTAWERFVDDDQHRELAKWFSNWGASSHQMLSSLSHPSFGGGLFAAVPFQEKYDDEDWLGFWGDKASASAETISIYCSFMLPILLLNGGFPFDGFEEQMADGNVVFDETNELHKHVKHGRGVLCSLILSLSTDSNREHVFPEYDLSLWRE